MSLLFVYGSLKRGFFNHHLICEMDLISVDRTRDKYCMLDLGPFPGVIDSRQVSSIQGEVFEVDDQLLRKLDLFEGDHYFRKQVYLERSPQAWMYFLFADMLKMTYPVVDSGIWNE